MLAKAISKYIRISPYKLRPYADVIRGKSVEKAYAWLKTCAVKRAEPLLKTLASAYANAKVKNPNLGGMSEVIVKEVRIDQGPTVKYFKPAAQGRAAPQRKRMSHISVIVDAKVQG
jgi:large subunit ribosomal protein L22